MQDRPGDKVRLQHILEVAIPLLIQKVETIIQLIP